MFINTNMWEKIKSTKYFVSKVSLAGSQVFRTAATTVLPPQGQNLNSQIQNLIKLPETHLPVRQRCNPKPTAADILNLMRSIWQINFVLLLWKRCKRCRAAAGRGVCPASYQCSGPECARNTSRFSLAAPTGCPTWRIGPSDGRWPGDTPEHTGDRVCILPGKVKDNQSSYWFHSAKSWRTWSINVCTSSFQDAKLELLKSITMQISSFKLGGFGDFQCWSTI